MASPIQLIVGLGNPGSNYEQTRHNAGVWFIEALARQYDVEFRAETKFKGSVARISVNHQECWLLIPATFMNHSGQSLGALAKFYKIPADAILVAHDELDFPVGKTRFKVGGGHGGHNGLQDIIAHIGSKDFLRLRIGIGHPGDRDRVTSYVLNRPSIADRQLIDASMDDALRQVPNLVAGDIQQAIKAVHTEN